MHPSLQVNFKRAGQFIQYIGSLEETIFQKRARIHQVALMSLFVCLAGSRVNLAGSILYRNIRWASFIFSLILFFLGPLFSHCYVNYSVLFKKSRILLC